MTRFIQTCVVLALLASTPAAHAEPTDHAPRTSSSAREHRLSLTWAPLRMFVPLVELTLEYRVHDKIGVSITAGGGQRTLTTSMSQITGTELEGGVQGRYYVVGDFSHGLELGAEALYEHVTFEEPLPAGVVGVAAGGFTAGPFLGYKVATRLGFTFEGQLGARYLVREPAMTGVGGPPPGMSRWLPLLHLNVGWSF